MDMNNSLESSLRQCETFAKQQRLVFRSITKSYDGKKKYIEYLMKEFKFDCTYDDFPILMNPTGFTVTINEENFEFQFQTFINVLFDESFMSLIVYAKSQDMIDKLFDFLEEKHNPNKCKMFVWNSWNGRYENSEYAVSRVDKENLVGLDDFFNSMKKEIQAIKENKELAMLLGASSGSNYFTHGPPGTGKTSSFKALGHDLNVPVYSINLSTMQKNQYKFALSPKTDEEIVIVIIEDFDRYIKDETKISELLNALDGVHSAYGVIRIFSANMPELTLHDKALKSRIKRFIKFDLPTSDNIYRHLLNVSKGDEHNAKVFANLCIGKELSYRDINNYLSRFITEDSLLGAAVEYFDQWMGEFDEIKELEEKRKDSLSKEPEGGGNMMSFDPTGLVGPDDSFDDDSSD